MAMTPFERVAAAVARIAGRVPAVRPAVDSAVALLLGHPEMHEAIPSPGGRVLNKVASLALLHEARVAGMPVDSSALHVRPADYLSFVEQYRLRPSARKPATRDMQGCKDAPAIIALVLPGTAPAIPSSAIDAVRHSITQYNQGFKPSRLDVHSACTFGTC